MHRLGLALQHLDHLRQLQAGILRLADDGTSDDPGVRILEGLADLEARDGNGQDATLRERLKQIREELGEGDGASADLKDLRDSIAKAGMPEEVQEQALKELARLDRMPEASGEYSMVRNYLDWLIGMPWSKLDAEQHDIDRARAVLDEDHHGLEKIKRRILEFLAVRKLNPQGRSPILCFVGPPGVGKTSLGQSIARALGLKFQRVSLGGVHDEAEIRGHRRTYIGALPGNIVQAVRKAGTLNPVLMLDEVDKLSASFQGDPSSALLEVLDPEQNNTFRDNFLAVPFDLSRVLFIATANVLENVPAPLRDRMEIIELTGYTEEEKLQIARHFLMRRQLAANGLTAAQVEISDEALRLLISQYTRESGIRSLERQIGAVLRHSAVQIAQGSPGPVQIGPADIERILGKPRFENEVAMRSGVPGVIQGLKMITGTPKSVKSRGLVVQSPNTMTALTRAPATASISSWVKDRSSGFLLLWVMAVSPVTWPPVGVSKLAFDGANMSSGRGRRCSWGNRSKKL